MYTIFDKGGGFLATVSETPDLKDLESRGEYLKEGDHTPPPPVIDVSEDNTPSRADLLDMIKELQKKVDSISDADVPIEKEV